MQYLCNTCFRNTRDTTKKLVEQRASLSDTAFISPELSYILVISSSAGASSTSRDAPEWALYHMASKVMQVVLLHTSHVSISLDGCSFDNCLRHQLYAQTDMSNTWRELEQTNVHISFSTRSSDLFLLFPCWLRCQHFSIFVTVEQI